MAATAPAIAPMMPPAAQPDTALRDVTMPTAVPFEVRPDMVADAIQAADALGRAWKKSHGEERPE